MGQLDHLETRSVLLETQDNNTTRPYPYAYPPPEYYAASQPQPQPVSQPVLRQPLCTDVYVKSKSEHRKDNSTHMIMASIFFLLGFMFPAAWIAAMPFLCSPSREARSFSIMSLFCCLFTVCVFIALMAVYGSMVTLLPFMFIIDGGNHTHGFHIPSESISYFIE